MTKNRFCRLKISSTVHVWSSNNLGYTDVIKGMVRMGLLSPNQHPALHSQVYNILCKNLQKMSFTGFFTNNSDNFFLSYIYLKEAWKFLNKSSADFFACFPYSFQKSTFYQNFIVTKIIEFFHIFFPNWFFDIKNHFR